MKVTSVSPRELGPSEISAWRRLQAGSSWLSSPYLAPEFAQAVGHARDDARVAVIEDGARVVGFFAHQARPDGRGEPVGAGICDAQAVIAAPGLDCDARWLIRQCGLDSWRFDHLRTEQPGFASFHDVVHRVPTLDLRGGFEVFRGAVRAVSKDVLAQVARRRRKLGREVGPVVTEWDEGADDAFEALARWKSGQYASLGTWDRFAVGWIRVVLDRLRATEGPGCAGTLATTRAGGHLVAVHFGLVGAAGLSWWFPAYCPDLAQYSPGLILLLDLAEASCDFGMPQLDLGRGEHGYKMRVATDNYTVAEGAVTGA